MLLGDCFSALHHDRLRRPEAPHAAAIAPRFPVGPCSLARCLQKCGPKLSLQGHSEISVKCVRGAVQVVLRILQALAEMMELSLNWHVFPHEFTGFHLITFQGIFGYTSVASMYRRCTSLQCSSSLRSRVPTW